MAIQQTDTEVLARNTSRKRVITIIAICVAALISIVVVMLAREVGEHETLAFDKNILLAIHTHTTPLLDTLAVHTTDLGSPAVVLVAALLIGLVLFIKKRMYRMYVVWGTVFGAAALVFAIKLLIERPRPQLWSNLLIQESGFSFTSGHATLSMALALALAAVLWYTRWRWLTVGLGALYVLYIGFTRLYLGVHYPTDIIGGWMVATAWAIIVVLTVRLLRNKNIVEPINKALLTRFKRKN